MRETIAILSDSLLDLDRKSTDYMIIEEQLKNGNPEFNEMEKALYIELPKEGALKLLSILFEIIERYGLTYYQIWKDKNEQGEYTKGISVEAIRDTCNVSIKAVKPLLGYIDDWEPILSV